MRSIRFPHAATLAGGCALVLASATQLAAQEREQQAYAPPPKAQPGVAQHSAEGQRLGAEADHTAMTQANQLTISEAQALADRAAAKNVELSKVLVSRHVDSIGRSLESAELHLAGLEAVPQSNQRRGQLQEIRAAYNNAAEHHARLTQLASQPKLDAPAIEQQAKEITADAEDAEVKNRQLIGEPAGKSSSKTKSPPGRPHDPKP